MEVELQPGDTSHRGDRCRLAFDCDLNNSSKPQRGPLAQRWREMRAWAKWLAIAAKLRSTTCCSHSAVRQLDFANISRAKNVSLRLRK